MSRDRVGLTSTDGVDDTERHDQVPWLQVARGECPNRLRLSELLASVTKALPKNPAVPASNPRIKKWLRR